jgi:hypothetical protein
MSHWMSKIQCREALEQASARCRRGAYNVGHKDNLSADRLRIIREVVPV